MIRAKKWIALGVVFAAVLSIAKDWYDPVIITTANAAQDASGDYSVAATQFMRDQGTINANGSMKIGDTISMQYQDGTIVTFTLGANFAQCTLRCVWSGEPFDPNKQPVIRQGARPAGGRIPQVIGLNPNAWLPAMTIYPSVTTVILNPTVTITQDYPAGSAIPLTGFQPSIGGGDGGGTGTGGGSGGGSGFSSCDPNCPPVDMK